MKLSAFNQLAVLHKYKIGMPVIFRGVARTVAAVRVDKQGDKVYDLARLGTDMKPILTNIPERVLTPEPA